MQDQQHQPKNSTSNPEPREPAQRPQERLRNSTSNSRTQEPTLNLNSQLRNQQATQKLKRQPGNPRSNPEIQKSTQERRGRYAGRSSFTSTLWPSHRCGSHALPRILVTRSASPSPPRISQVCERLPCHPLPLSLDCVPVSSLLLNLPRLLLPQPPLLRSLSFVPESAPRALVAEGDRRSGRPYR